MRDKLGLLSATILTLGLGAVMPAMAQETPQAAEAAEEGDDVIVVTGSRLRRETFDSPNPTVQVGSERMDARQMSNTIDAIEDLPLVGIGSNSRGTNVQFGDNFAFPNVLSIGSQRTLSLLNGRRVVASNQGTVFVPGNASGAQVDLSMINPMLIERVDVLTATGGAIYGADAVGGVVNIITKDNFEGLDLRASAGVTQVGDGEQYRASGLWGGNFFDDRANITVSLDYFEQDMITTSTENFARFLGTGLGINQIDAGQRNSAPFSVASAISTLQGGGTLPNVFLPSGSNGMPNNFYGPMPMSNPLISEHGVLVSRFLFNGGFSANTPLIPGGTVAPAQAGCGLGPNGIPVFAVTTLTGCTTAANVFTAFGVSGTGGLTATQQNTLALQLLQRNLPTPYEYAAANPSLNPMLFAGLFGPGAFNGGFPTITNATATPIPTAGLPAGFNVALNALFPRMAAPYGFDASGNLVPYNIGAIMPPLQSRLGQTYSSPDYYDPFAEGHQQIQAGSERFSFATTGHFDITDNIRLVQEIFYTDFLFTSVAPGLTNAPSGSGTAGSTAIPIYVNQNPFLSTSARNQVSTLVAQGWSPLTQIGGQDVIYMGRALTDLTGGGAGQENEVTTYRIAEALEGDFDLFDRAFYWDVAAAYGRAQSINRAEQLLDIEFALATDVVDSDPGPGVNPVCRQQTLGAPESIAIRNPGLAGINTTLSLTPTAAQVAACVPLNLFGNGAPSQEAIDYVTTDGGTRNLNTQEYYAASFGGEVVRLPAGFLSMGVQGEFRRESIEFEPGESARLGASRNTTIQPGDGELEFKEYGYEVRVPIFGEGFQFPLMEALEFNYAFRIVERTQASTSPFFPVQGDGTKDDTFNYSIQWQPIEDVTFRGSRSRTVRSASLVELFGPPSSGFGAWAANTHPCTPTSISQGPNPNVRRANCIAAVQALGIAADATSAQTFLNTFQDVAVARPAAAVGNPFLNNEEGNAYSYGITYQPRAIPRLTLAADFFAVDVSGLVGLNGPPLTTNQCFDDASFPNSSLNGSPACDMFVFGVFNGTNYVVPSINPITGNPLPPGAIPGALAQVQSPFEPAFLTFPNLNLGVLETRGVNFEIRYNFPLSDLPLVGGVMGNWGDIFLSTSMFQMQRQDVFGDNVNLTDRIAGEHGTPEYETATTIRHRIGPLDHSLQWFWTSGTVTNILTSKSLYPDQSQNFIASDFHYFNYSASYDLTDNMTLRLTINNLADTLEPRGQYGNPNQFDGGVGREFIFGVNARF